MRLRFLEITDLENIETDFETKEKTVYTRGGAGIFENSQRTFLNMATALKAIGTLALGSHRGLLATLQGHSASRTLTSSCDTNICGRKLTDAKACANFGVDKKNCKGECITGFHASGDNCLIDDVDLKTVSPSAIFATGMAETADWTDAAIRRKERKKNARRWFKDAFTAHKGKAVNTGKINRELRKELRLELDKDNDFSATAKQTLEEKLGTSKKIYMKPGPVNKAPDGTPEAEKYDSCASNPTADNDTCVTTLLGLDGDDVDKNVLGCDDGCWQVGGFLNPAGDLTPVIRQKRASADADYKMACWTGSAWTDDVDKAPGDIMSCEVGLRTIEVLVDSMTTTGDVSVADYHSDSLVPRGSTDKTFYTAFDDRIQEAKMEKIGNDIKVTVETDVKIDSTVNLWQCSLVVDVAHNNAATGSDATLRDANLFQKGLAVTATNQTANGGSSFTFEVLVKPSSYDLDANDKLHVGRLGVELTAALECTGSWGDGITQDGIGADTSTGVQFYQEGDDGKVKAHALHYDLKAQGMVPTDVAGNLIDGFGVNADAAKHTYTYAAPFTHKHDQVVFPETSIVGSEIAPETHFHAPGTPADPICRWNHGTFSTALSALGDITTLGWQSAVDSAQHTHAYSGWTKDNCGDDGMCSILKKIATVNVDGTTNVAYLPFDKPHSEYYSVQPTVECTSQNTTGDATLTFTPDLDGDYATSGPIISDLLTGHQTLTATGCATKNGLSSDICVKTDADTGSVIALLPATGGLYSVVAKTEHFNHLIDGTFDFGVASDCQSSDESGDACVIESNTDAGKISSLDRDGIAKIMTDKQSAVSALTFSLPTKYGTTFGTYTANIGGGVVASTDKYRARGNFAVTMDAVDTDPTITWLGGGAIIAKSFDGPGLDLPASARVHQILSAKHVTGAVKTGFYGTNDANFTETAQNSGIFVLSPFEFPANEDPSLRENLPNVTTGVVTHTDSADCQTAGDDKSIRCRSNGFVPVDCLASELKVRYTINTPSDDDRYPGDTGIAEITWSKAKTDSPSKDDVGFDTPSTGGIQAGIGFAGDPQGAATVAVNVGTDYMGSSSVNFGRQTADGTVTYNCEATDSESISYTANVAAPCGEAGHSGYDLTTTKETRYVYSAGTNDKKDQVSQTVKNDDETTVWTTTEWHVQESKSDLDDSDSADDGNYILLTLTIAPDASVNGFNAAMHLPASEVSVVDDVSASVGTARLKAGSCVTAQDGTRTCIIEYYNDDEYKVSQGKTCNTTSTPVVGEPDCPVISYKLAASVRNGNFADAFGQTGACGSPASDATDIPLAPGGSVQRSLDLIVSGNARAYDGVIDVKAKIGDVLKTDPIATEIQHGVTVPGKDHIATTILDVPEDAAGDLDKVTGSKNIAFMVEYLITGTGARTFTIAGLPINVDRWGTGDIPNFGTLPALSVCNTQDFQDGVCVSGTGDPTTELDTQKDCTNPYEVVSGNTITYHATPQYENDVLTSTIDEDCKKKFYVSLGDDPDLDICLNSEVGADPYTYKDRPFLGFSISVTYDTENGGSGLADAGVEHNYMFKVKCPSKDYSLNIRNNDEVTRKSISQGGHVGLVNKALFAKSHNDKITLDLFFSGRSTDKIGAGREYADLKLVTNSDVDMLDAAGAPAASIPGSRVGGSNDNALPVTFQFKTECLFTELILKSAPSDQEEDVEFRFKLQCPRVSDAASDALDLDYQIGDVTFGNGGGSIGITQPNSSGFTSIVTGLMSSDESLCSPSTEPNNGCAFGTSAGTQTLAGPTGDPSNSIATWFTYLEGCGFSDAVEAGVYVGSVQRRYNRTSAVGGDDAQYCGGRDISFGVKMTGSHSAYIFVDNPKSMEFGVQATHLYWDNCAFTPGDSTSGKRLMATIEVHRAFDENALGLASKDAVTDISLTNFANQNQALGGHSGGVLGDQAALTVAGQCLQNPSDSAVESDAACDVFTDERKIQFGVVHSLNGIDYRGDLSVTLKLSCPLSTKSGSNNQDIPMMHTSKCSGYGSDFADPCEYLDTDEDGICDYNDDNGNGQQEIDDEPCTTASVPSDNQIQLELIIQDDAFAQHTVSMPTITIGSGSAEPVESLDDTYTAQGADGSAIPLVGAGGISTGFKTSEVQNSKVTLRALALSGQRVTITWNVVRVAQQRRMLRQVSYTLGADGSSSGGTEGAGFVVLPATREGESDSIVTGEALSEAEASAGTTHTHEHHVDDHQEEGWGLWVFVIVGGGLLVTVVLVAVFSNGQKEVVYASTAPGYAGKYLKSRMYNYARVGGFDESRFRD